MEAWWSRATPVRGLIRLSGGPTGAGLTVVRSYNSRVEGGGDGKKSHFKSPFVCRSANLIRKVLLFLAGRHSFVCSVFRPPTPASWLWKKPERQHWDHSRVCLLFFCDILMKWFYNIHDNFFFWSRTLLFALSYRFCVALPLTAGVVYLFFSPCSTCQLCHVQRSHLQLRSARSVRFSICNFQAAVAHLYFPLLQE